MPRAVLIANPSASQFTGGVFRQIKTTLSKAYDLSTEWPVSADQTRVVSGAAADDHVDVVFAMGGDGVAHHVANGLVGSSTALGIIPVGTTNVLSRILGIPQSADKAAEGSVEWRPLPTRTVRIDAETLSGSMTRHAVFSVGIGFDADVVESAETRPFAKSRFGSVHYASTAISRLLSSWRSEQPNLRMTCDGDRFDALVALTQVHDPYTYFGMLPLRLTSEPPEGIATLAANNLGIGRAAEIFTRAAAGIRHREATGVQLWTNYEKLSVDAEPTSPFQADGEMLGHAAAIDLTPDEQGLLVLRPPDGDDG
ncbi:MAG: diacylglycerol/lipid kinase family protein [Acidimicrobiia bacterium]